MRRTLIDTSIYSLAMRGDPEVIDRLQHLDEIGFTVISMGELLAGFRQGTKETRNREELARFLDASRVRLLALDEATHALTRMVEGLKTKVEGQNARPSQTFDFRP